MRDASRTHSSSQRGDRNRRPDEPHARRPGLALPLRPATYQCGNHLEEWCVANGRWRPTRQTGRQRNSRHTPMLREELRQVATEADVATVRGDALGVHAGQLLAGVSEFLHRFVPLATDLTHRFAERVDRSRATERFGDGGQPYANTPAPVPGLNGSWLTARSPSAASSRAACGCRTASASPCSPRRPRTCRAGTIRSDRRRC